MISSRVNPALPVRLFIIVMRYPVIVFKAYSFNVGSGKKICKSRPGETEMDYLSMLQSFI
jgi:hypothetical protein